MQQLCDYSDFDYKKKFWDDSNRQYEHESEIFYVHYLLKKYCNSHQVLIDAGCGFGRLFTSYESLFNSFILIDYASNLLNQAKTQISTMKPIQFIQQSLYPLTLPQQADAMISIRTLHHLNDITSLFNQFNRSLFVGGILILDVPNHYHLKYKIKNLLKRNKRNSLIKISNCYYNYDPDYIIDCLNNHGFRVKKKIQVGLFRLPIIKQIIPSRILVQCEQMLNNIYSNWNIGPSVYLVCEKIVDKTVNN